jgi:hypothetical protein
MEGMMKITAELTGRERRYVEHAQRAQTQGLTLAQYCRETGVSVQSLYNAKRELRRKGALEKVAEPPQSEPADFIAVRVAHPSPSAGGGSVCRLRAANGWVLECTSWPSASWVVECLGGGTHAST